MPFDYNGRFAKPKEKPAPERLSYSSLSELAECGERWRLKRMFGLPEEETWWATVAGSALHEGFDAINNLFIEGVGAWPNFKQLFEKHEAEVLAAGIQPKPSGRKLKEVAWAGGPNKRDRDWWLEYGPKFPPAYSAWVQEKLDEGWEIIATEFEFEVQIGAETVRGSIDLVMADPDDNITIIDSKTGKQPVTRLQLGTYGIAWRALTGIPAALAYHLMFDVEKREEPELDPKTGEPARYLRGEKKGQLKGSVKIVEGDVFARLASKTDLAVYSEHYVEAQFAIARAQVEQNLFLANTRDCGTCPVFQHCRAVNGDKSMLVPVAVPRRVGGESVAPSL